MNIKIKGSVLEKWYFTNGNSYIMKTGNYNRANTYITIYRRKYNYYFNTNIEDLKI